MMKTITNFKIKDFIKQDVELINEYVNILQYSLPIDTENKVFDLSLREVEFIKTHLFSDNTEDLIEIISTVQNLTASEVYELPITTFYGLHKSITEQIKTIVEGEENALRSTHINFKWEQVRGSERLSRFGIYNIIDSLAGGDILKYDTIFELPYAVVMQKLIMDKIKDDLQLEMGKIKQEKIL